MAKGTARDLVVVESPAKARTVGRFLGDGYVVKASLGHVRDLPAHDMGVDIEHDFRPTYVPVPGREAAVRDIRRAAADAGTVYLATDPDREGEAISWHLVELAGLSRGGKPVRRVVFHEITAPAIEEAFRHPRDIDMQLVNAQQARRVLDRIVGYRLSPVLWRKIRRGLSAGRVQSVALRLIVDREREIEAFTPQEYWLVSVRLEKEDDRRSGFRAWLREVEGRKGRVRVRTGEEAGAIAADLNRAAYAVGSVETKAVRTRPQPPFTTSTLQQDAARRLRFGAQRTMRVAQELYEGVQLGAGEPVGLITYIRTDSTNLAQSALAEANAFIRERFGPEYAGRPRVYKTSSRSAQEAHEAIRPTSVHRTPETVGRHLTTDQAKLYELIWRRMVASQMTDAVADSTTADVVADGTPSGTAYLLRATGVVPRFDGFLVVYREAAEDEAGRDEEERRLPPLARGERARLVGVDTEQRFTQPPPRYSEATLIRTLEEKGIGRPSTYATIVDTIERREYVAREDRRFKPTKLGIAVTDLLAENFPDIMDPGFTAEMESKLDAVANGQIDWVPMLDKFYGPFDSQVERAAQEAKKVPWLELAEPSGEVCEECERPMVVAHGRRGRFLACSGFPECRNSRPLRRSAGVKCPVDGGELLVKRSSRGRTFYGCSNYPACTFTTRRRPFKEPCPECGG
ncbi:MAG: type I DNA topoisomerase, partial [Gemmatimonadetes bacterium]|nr:type I DNA topoisomerase [Gemmatimonadota bacterium]